MNAPDEIYQHFRFEDAPPARWLALDCLQQPDAALPLFSPLLANAPRHEHPAQFSRWSQWYFALLLTPWSKINLLYRWQLPVSLAQLSLRLSPEGVPMEFRFSHRGTPCAEDLPEARFGPLMTQQIAPVCRTLATLSGLSPALLWNNAAVRMERGMTQAAASGVDIRPLQQLLDSRYLSDGQRNLLWQPVREVCGTAGRRQRERRLCCLRGEIAGEKLCASCPLKRRQQARQSETAAAE